MSNPALDTTTRRLGWATMAVAVASAIHAAVHAPSPVLLAALQTSATGWFIAFAYHRDRRWATPGVVLGVSWIAVFLAPCWIYAADPDLLDYGSLPDVLALVNFSLFAMAGGYVLAATITGLGDRRGASPSYAGAEPSYGWTVAWFGIGFAAMATLVAVNGGPGEWITNLDQTGRMAAGLTYVVWIGLAARYAAVALVASRWAQGASVERTIWGLFASALALTAILGARLFIAVALVELLLLHAVLRRPIGLRVLVPVGLAAALVLVFGLGTVKRHQTYNSGRPASERVALPYYATHIAVSEAAAAYANNYADGVRLLAAARDLVPSAADYEFGSGLLRLLVQPIPGSIRPDVTDDGPIEKTFYSTEEGSSYALPLQLFGYTQFGIVGVCLVAALLGAAAALLAQLLLNPGRSLPLLIALTAAAVQLPVVLRTGVPRGIAVAMIEIVGSFVVAWTIIRHSGPHHAPRAAPAPRRSPQMT